MPSLHKLTWIRILQYDFSDPQASKDVCDRRQATLKSHMRRFIKEGNDENEAGDTKAEIK